ncbi:hypothetical protein CSOJ01_03404 [Colletotrichum sojae]|uniref:Uncharacterized protein n=1 Tax=Colletotrichum sojae TaxID=2175907 RepID=A0A8H6JM25_9PEZI|nr:hypothetical protein CSOJ01_03404 [Colletotrichum sojae]
MEGEKLHELERFNDLKEPSGERSTSNGCTLQSRRLKAAKAPRTFYYGLSSNALTINSLKKDLKLAHHQILTTLPIKNIKPQHVGEEINIRDTAKLNIGAQRYSALSSTDFRSITLTDPTTYDDDDDHESRPRTRNAEQDCDPTGVEIGTAEDTVRNTAAKRK